MTTPTVTREVAWGAIGIHVTDSVSLCEGSKQQTFIYFARVGFALKIGRSERPSRRIRDLSAGGEPHRLMLVIADAIPADELGIHRILQAERIGSERFRGAKTEMLLAALLQVAEPSQEAA
jgi:hypothetical protein